jgi:16S rRNA (guanine966-N2)-methyltransferase
MMTMARQKSSARSGSVRIIGGRWGGRRVPVPATSDVRPTGDRVRETLFNWLAPVIDGARCLDLFAGSGVLGLEALSRGASEVCFVERHGPAADQLERVLGTFECQTAKVVHGDALRYLGGAPTPFTLIFRDPPFGAIDIEHLCKLLEDGWLQDRAYIYLELGKHGHLPALPPGWQIFREKVAGEVRFALARKQ